MGVLDFTEKGNTLRVAPTRGEAKGPFSEVPEPAALKAGLAMVLPASYKVHNI